MHTHTRPHCAEPCLVAGAHCNLSAHHSPSSGTSRGDPHHALQAARLRGQLEQRKLSNATALARTALDLALARNAVQA